ncbi:MAG: type III-A CRISPR-associated RAMP protein Csm3 [Chloroflexota bacterium]
MSERKIELKGRIFIHFDIEAKTGLHIGGSDTGVEIGGVDKTVIRDKLTNRPYIPGSSLKGKMRSLLEKYKGLKQNQRIGQGYIHSCGAEYKKDDPRGYQEYQKCDVCEVFGVPGERDFATPTRLVVRDTFLSEESAKELENAQTDLPYTEVKTEVAIDRVTSAANPRQMERIPAGAIFSDAELVLSLYEIHQGNGDVHKATDDLNRLAVLLEAMRLVEDDYLGGLGSRGSGKVTFTNIRVSFRKNAANEAESLHKEPFSSLADFAAGFEDLKKKIIL